MPAFKITLIASTVSVDTLTRKFDKSDHKVRFI